ncbi:MAG: RIP metalloprotease RseP [Thermodesulfobacteriota bacteirum]|nr:RIP metalloprotease RseP [Thermodesulfobacteriota bacterium]
MTSLISFILIISFLIFIHELGHLLAAKWANVKVENFSIGFGPKLFSFYIGETEYALSLLPLGGYVKMQGEDVSELKTPQNKEALDPSRSYKNIPNIKKLIILFAGPFMNLVLPFILFPFIYMNGIELPKFLDQQPVVGYYEQSTEKAFFQNGDKILEINKYQIKNWRDIPKLKEKFKNIKQNILISRQNNILEITFYNNLKDKKYILDDIYPEQLPIVNQILPNSIASNVGIEKSDRILNMNGKNINSWYQISKILNEENLFKYEIQLQRNDQVITKNIRFEKESVKKVLGITPLVNSEVSNFSIIESFNLGWKDSVRSINLIYNGIIGLFSDFFSTDSSLSKIKNSIAGPISIAKYSGVAAEKGLNSILQFLIIISINLGIINLLPIPLLDGGHIFFTSIEMITRRKMNPKIQNFANRTGFALLITLMLFAVYNDIVNL